MNLARTSDFVWSPDGRFIALITWAILGSLKWRRSISHS